MTLRTRSTIRVISFFFTVAVLAIAVFIANSALNSVDETVHAGVGSVANTGDRLAIVQEATLRLVALSQAALTGATDDQLREADSLVAVADSVRRLLVTESSFGTEGRTHLELIGMLRARIEVRLAVAAAHRENGDVDQAYEEENQAANTLDTLLTESAALSADQLQRTATTFTAIGEEAIRNRKVVMSLLVLGLAGAVSTLVSFRWA